MKKRLRYLVPTLPQSLIVRLVIPRVVSLTPGLGKAVEQFILSAITWYVQDNHGIRPSQHGFMKDRSCLTNLISF